jgi:hypothetical protein
VAKANERPTIDVQAGFAALEQDLPRVLRILEAPSIEALGWSRPNKLCLLIPMTGTFSDKVDEYVLRLAFQSYRAWPPSAQFVNPQTGTYVYPQDQQFVPKLTSPECQTHVVYEHPPGTGTIQLICCSATLEFYEVLHGVQPNHLWRETDSFFTTIMAIRKALTSSYQGRFPASGK